MPDFNGDELDLIEQVLQNQEEIFRDSDQEGDMPSGFVVGDGIDLSVEEYGKMVTRILQKIHGVDEMSFACPDCGMEGEMRGHMECQYPQDIPDDSGLEDPMMRER